MKQSRSLFNSVGCLFALTSLLINSSCSQDEFAMMPVQDGQAKFSISLPGEIGTRASFGDEEKAIVNTLYWTLFETVDGQQADDAPSYKKIATSVVEGAFGNGGKRTETLSMPLVAGKDYRIIFCAMNSDNKLVSYNEGKLEMHYADAVCNSVNDDVFTAVYDLTEDTGYSGDIILSRPLAQVNWGSTDFDEDTVAPHIEDTSATITYHSGLYSSLDLLDGSVAGLIETSVSFPAIDCGNLPGQDFPVAGNVAKLLAMNYVLTEFDKSATINCEISFEGSLNTNVMVNNAPVRTNYRTNIYGGLITNSSEVSVEMNKAFETSSNDERYLTPETKRVFSELQEKKSLIEIPAEETIDLTGLGKIYLTNGQKFILNGTLILDSQQLVLKANSSIKNTVIFEGDGIIYANANSPISILNGAKGIFNGIKIYCESTKAAYAFKSNGEVVLNSVTIKSMTGGLAVMDGGYLTAENCNIVVNQKKNSDSYAAFYVEMGNANISNCTMSASLSHAFKARTGHVVMSNCKLEAHGTSEAIRLIEESKLTLIDCTAESEKSSVLYADGGDTSVHLDGGYFHSRSKDQHAFTLEEYATGYFERCNVVSEGGAAVKLCDNSNLTIGSGRYLSLGQSGSTLLFDKKSNLQVNGGQFITNADSSIKQLDNAAGDNLFLRGGEYSAKYDIGGEIYDLPAYEGYEVAEIDSVTPDGFRLRYKIGKIK